MFNLLDDYAETGDSLSSYMEAAKHMDDNTYIQTADLSDAHIYSFFKRDKNRLLCHHFEPQGLNMSDDGMYVMNQLISLNYGSLNSAEIPLIKEFCEQSKTLFKFPSYEKGYFFIGNSAYKTLNARQSGVGGKLLRTPGYVRNLALSESLSMEYGPVNMIIRTNGHLRKIFAIHKERFSRRSCTDLGKLISKLQGVKEVIWRITHETTTVYVEFNRMVESMFIPGALFTISDTGYHSATVAYTMRHKNHNMEDYYVLEEISLSEQLYSKESVSDVTHAIKDIEDKYVSKLVKLLKNKQINPTQFCVAANLAPMVGIKAKISITDAVKSRIYNNNREILEDILNISDKNFSSYQHEQYRKCLCNILNGSERSLKGGD